MLRLLPTLTDLKSKSTFNINNVQACLIIRFIQLKRKHMNNSSNDLCIYFRPIPDKDRFISGDRFIRPWIRKIIRKKQTSGVEKVFVNLCKGFDNLGIKYIVNKPFYKIQPGDKIIVLGTGKHALDGYTKSNKIVAGIGLMTHPSEWPDLIANYPVAKYLQHSDWANNVYKPYYGNSICDTWFAGIETDKWKPSGEIPKTIDVLIYNKLRWKKEYYNQTLTDPIKHKLSENKLTFTELTYGSYNEDDYQKLLQQSKTMIFLCEHESQGIACCEALSMNVPVFAWVNGFCLDPNRFNWNDTVIPATSIPFFDERCGDKFQSITEFEANFELFFTKAESLCFKPRDYILENLTLEKSSLRMLEIVDSVS